MMQKQLRVKEISHKKMILKCSLRDNSIKETYIHEYCL